MAMRSRRPHRALAARTKVLRVTSRSRACAWVVATAAASCAMQSHARASGPAPVVRRSELQPPEQDADGVVPETPRSARARSQTPALHRYLTRELSPSARFLDHGVIALSLAGGYPHRYRLGAAIGLLDHLSLGATAHWLPGQSRPHVSAQVALAFYRWRHVELGAIYDRIAYPPPERDQDPKTPSYQRDAHVVAAAIAFSQQWVSAGVEVGIAYGREHDPGREDSDDSSNPKLWRLRPGGGVFVRAGTRRWGFVATARAPFWMAELAFDLRFGAFELRSRGGWRPRGIVRAGDRRVPLRSGP